MTRKLIVNADDFGLCQGVNRGVVTAFRQGIVTSTTMMVNMPGFPSAVALATEFPALAVGLHLNLTYGRPVLPVEQVGSLVDSGGSFVRNPRFVLANGRTEEMRAEFRAQVERFQTTGLPLSHLDTHHHLHLAEQVLDLVAGLARELGVTVRSLNDGALCARGVEPEARYMNFYAGRNGAEKLIGLLAALPEGITEMPCHPGYVDDELRQLSDAVEVREWELQAVTDPRVRQSVEANSVFLTNFPKLRASDR